MADVLLTGSTGLLGTRLLPALARDHQVTAVARRPPPDTSPSVRWLAQDLAEAGLARNLPSRADVVIHLAQASTFREFPEKAMETFRVNVESTAQLLAWAQGAGVSQFILASTGSVYTDRGGMPHREDEPLLVSSLASHYAASKLAGEVLAMSYQSHFPVVVFRPFAIYGPGQDATMLVPRLVESVRMEQPIRLTGADGLRVNPIYVTDAVEAVMASIAVRNTEILNLAGPEVVSLRQMAECIGTALGTAPTFTTVPGEPVTVVGDIEKMTKLLGPPTVRFEDVVAELCR